MTMRDRSARRAGAAALAATLALFVLGACEDTEAQRRAEIQATIAEAGRAIEQAALVPVIAGDPAVEQARTALRRTVQSLKSINDGAAGQQSAAALLASSAYRDLAAMAAAEANALEHAHHQEHVVTLGMLESAERLGRIAENQGTTGSDALRDSLADARRRAQSALADARGRLAEYGTPIDEREQQNEQDLREASDLEQQANELRRDAVRAGPAAGLASFERAVQLERAADQYEYQIAQRENDLRYELRPEHEITAARIASLESLLSEIDGTLRGLDTHDGDVASRIDATRAIADDLADEIDRTLLGLAEERAGALGEHYDTAAAELENAITQARRAASKGERGNAGAANVAMARALTAKGRLLLEQARGLDGMRHLVAVRASAATLGSTPSGIARADDLAALHDAALASAKEAYTAAKEALGAVSGRESATAVAQYTQSIDDALRSMSGERVSDGGSGGGDGGGGGGGGYDTPEQLVGLINVLQDGDPARAMQFFDAMHTSTPEARTAIDAIRSMFGGITNLTAAMRETFGESEAIGAITGQMSQMGDMMPVSARLTDRGEDRATVTVLDAAGEEDTAELVRVDGKWYVSADDIVDEMTPMQAAQLRQMGTVMGGAFERLASRIRAGEFSSEEEIGAAMMQMMMQMGGPGGAPGAGMGDMGGVDRPSMSGR